MVAVFTDFRFRLVERTRHTVAWITRRGHTPGMELTAVYAATPIFLASLMGSAHCAGMCGGFVAIYAHDSRRHWLAHLLYSVGRLLTYLGLGVGSAFIGQTIDSAFSVAKVSSLVVGGILIAVGILKILGLTPLHQTESLTGLSKPVGALLKPVLQSDSSWKPFFIGSLTTLLPCGWLYSFVAVALASADPLHGVAIMTVFWLGTLPVMVTLAILSRSLTQRFAAYLPRVTGVLLVVSGLLSFALHLQHADHSHHGSHHHHHHGD